MAEETNKAAAPPTVTEAVQTDVDRATSEESIDAMLAKIPGMDKYFGDDSSDALKGEKTVTEKADASPDQSPEPAGAITDEVLAGGAKEEDKKLSEEDKAPLPEAVQKRIDRLTALRHELEDSVSALEKERDSLKAKLSDAGVRDTQSVAAAALGADDPLKAVTSYEQLEQALIDARIAKSWALENLDGGTVQVNKETGETRELSGQEVKQLLSWSERLITEHIPRKKAYIDSRLDYDRQAETYYPDLLKPESELAKTVQSWMKVFPAVTQFPDFKLIIADALVGQKIRFGRLAAKNGQAPKTPTLAAPSPSASARVPAKSVLSKDLLDRMATDRSALDIFSESLIGTGKKK